MTTELSARILSRVREVPREVWNAVVGDGTPFLEWDWLDALEETECAVPEAGWLPQHLTLWRGAKLVALAPAYVKGNSGGEFVFDMSWAELAQRLGLRYYPKLIVAVPFTPATGSRFAVASGEPRAELVTALIRVARAVADEHELSSVHLLFCDEEDVRLAEPLGFHHRMDVQFHWQNAGYGGFEDFLGRMGSKRRTMIRRERAQLAKDGVTIETVTGPALAAHARTAYELYESQIDKFYWGHRYLTPAMFEAMFTRFAHRLELVAAMRGGRVIAGAVNAVKGARIYGRYWGEREKLPFMHFNVCYYHTIDECIRKGVGTFEPGSGGMSHKFPRGFDPVLTHSAHWLREPRFAKIIGDFLARERPSLRAERARILSESPLRRAP
jgi:predicted N-acyltransferase